MVGFPFKDRWKFPLNFLVQNLLQSLRINHAGSISETYRQSAMWCGGQKLIYNSCNRKWHILNLGAIGRWGYFGPEVSVQQQPKVQALEVIVQHQAYFYLFIMALQHKCWRSVGHQVLQPAKHGNLGQYIWKVADRRKNPWCTRTATNLQPSDLCSNAYRSLPGDQDIFSLLFSCIYIHRNPRKWLIILKLLLVEPNGHCFIYYGFTAQVLKVCRT